MPKPVATPGVYIEEQSAFPNSLIPAPTAVPASIGYTEKAVLNHREVAQQAVRITSFAEYESCFGGAATTTYRIGSRQADKPKQSLELLPSSQRFLLYNCMKHFFANGGNVCYIVSIGNYSSKIALSDFDSEPDAPQARGLSVLNLEPEPTLLVIPDAVLLPEADCAELQRRMLRHCGETRQNRFAILDVFDGYQPRTPNDDGDVIARFRQNVGNEYLQWGAAYYPWVHTYMIGLETVNFLYLDAAGRLTLSALLLEEVAANLAGKSIDTPRADAIKAEIKKLTIVATEADAGKLHQTLLQCSPMYKSILVQLLEQSNLLPPAAGMAGVYCKVDNATGVFQSPANVSFAGVLDPAVLINNNDQADLNVPINGKAVNAIRTFPGLGVLVWGARTLDGNSMDWRYINVRRTVIYFEQSIKTGLQAFVFEPNSADTWTSVRSMIENFLTNEWKSGALSGASAADAFSVSVGLGSTMTADDLLNGIMNVSVKVAVTRPAEYIVLTFTQQMQSV